MVPHVEFTPRQRAALSIYGYGPKLSPTKDRSRSHCVSYWLLTQGQGINLFGLNEIHADRRPIIHQPANTTSVTGIVRSWFLISLCRYGWW